MKILLGKYKDCWIGPYQIANTLKIFGYSDDECYSIGEKLYSNKYLVNFCEWFYDHNPFKKRTVIVKIDNFDVWNMQDSLALIIYPMLVKLKENKQGSPYVEDCHVPDRLKSMNAPRVTNQWDTDDNFHKRWEWVLDEMIWSFEQYQPGKSIEDSFYTYPEESEFGYKDMLLDTDGYNAYQDRIKNGFNLFSRYYMDLWT